MSKDLFSPPFHIWPDLWHQAYQDKPLWSGKSAPFDEQHRDKWRAWYRKWRQAGCPKWPALEDAYKALDRKKSHV